MLPNFIVIGALKAGTTSLWAYLGEHPQIYLPKLKEPRFFAFDKTNPDHLKKVPSVWPVTTLEAYSKLFEGVTAESVIGEVSPNYMHSQLAARRIRATIPDVKLIASLRNPANRVFSAYLMRHGQGVETRPFKRAFQEDRESYWVKTSLYFSNLKRYFDLFDSRQMKIILFENLKKEPSVVVKDLYRFLGVNEAFTPDVSAVYNKGGIPKSKVLYFLLNSIAKSRSTFAGYAPSGLQSFFRKIKNWNLENPKFMLEETYGDVIDFYKEDIMKTEDLLNMDLSLWYGPRP